MRKLLMFILMAVIVAGSCLALPATLEEVKFDDTSLGAGTNRLDVERGEEYEIEVLFTPDVDLDDVEVEAYISGYEYSEDERIADHVGPFDADADVTYRKKLNLRIPDDAEEDSYMLRVMVSDRDNTPLIENYELKISLPRHDVSISDVIVNPNNVVESGGAIIVVVRVDNNGDQDEDDVKVVVSIPELGISNTEYIDEIESEDEESSEELFLRIPRCSEAGVYEIDIDVAYSNKHKHATSKRSIQVLEDESCGKEALSAEEKTVIALGAQSKSGNPGTDLVYPITFSNKGNGARMFSVSAENVDWADISVSPSNSLIVKAKESEIVYLNVKLSEDAAEGSKSFKVNILSDDETKVVPLTANVVLPQSSETGWLELIVVALVVIVIVLGLFVIFRSREDKDYY